MCIRDRVMCVWQILSVILEVRLCVHVSCFQWLFPQQPLGQMHCRWPSLSLDLTPIKHARDQLGRRDSQKQAPQTLLLELRRVLTDEWNRLPLHVFQNLVNSMHSHCNAVLLQTVATLAFEIAVNGFRFLWLFKLTPTLLFSFHWPLLLLVFFHT